MLSGGRHCLRDAAASSLTREVSEVVGEIMAKTKQRKNKRLDFMGKFKNKDGGSDASGRPKSSDQHVKEQRKQEEVRKQRELQDRQKVSREQEQMKRRNLQSFQSDILQRQREFEQKESDMQSLEKNVVEASDVILEVLDARDPLGCRCPQVEQAVIQSGTNKKIVLVLNKIDLVSKEIVEKWIKYLRNEFPTLAFKASTQQQNKNLKRSTVPVTQATPELLSTSACIGADCLMKLLANYCRNLDIKTAITLLDCPGIVMATSTSDAAMILRNCVKIEQLVDPISPVEAILRRCNKAEILKHYGVPNFRTALEFLAMLARRQGKLRKGGLPDTDKAAKSVLMDWTGGRISYFTHPPETHTLPTHVSAAIVTEMGKAFDLDELEKGNQEVLAESSCPDVKMGFCMETTGMTEGGQGELPSDLGMWEEPEFKDKTESMEDGKDTEFGPMTVEIKSPRSKTPLPGDAADKAPDLKDIVGVHPLQQGQALRAAGKKRKKQQKRADKISVKLSDTLTAAMDFSFSDD
ncbi:hypothetical protein F7725_016574 [Dissostichus mawsoni]|uniref:Guanine nucleotide-binding protein-like 3 n=1 Tax=Dissostichus mawsoni TaxID=36200 RepID=A0A7J5Z3Y9_DISMA|nr:hypothetical protein F7725_016574 [Dissostichus mawsoni]